MVSRKRQSGDIVQQRLFLVLTNSVDVPFCQWTGAGKSQSVGR
jgi:hypothetical protein